MMVFASGNKPDASLTRIDACALTEVALGISRADVALRLIVTAIGIIGETDHGGGLPMHIVAGKITRLARELDTIAELLDPHT